MSEEFIVPLHDHSDPVNYVEDLLEAFAAKGVHYEPEDVAGGSLLIKYREQANRDEAEVSSQIN